MRIKDVELTEEQEAKLRGLMPITATGEFWYTPKQYRDLPQSCWPAFRLRPLSGPETVLAEDALHSTAEVGLDGKTRNITFRRGEYTMQVCRGHVMEWRNYRDAHGDEVKYDKALATLPPDVLYELAEAIQAPERYRLSADEVRGLGL